MSADQWDLQVQWVLAGCQDSRDLKALQDKRGGKDLMDNLVFPDDLDPTSVHPGPLDQQVN